MYCLLIAGPMNSLFSVSLEEQKGSSRKIYSSRKHADHVEILLTS